MMRWLIIIAIAAVVIGTGAYWLGPGVVPRSRLELLAFDATGQFSAEARLAVPDSTIGNEIRYPLVLAIRNTGSRTETPQELSLALPGWARLLGPTGAELESTDEGEELLHAYHVELAGEPVEPGALPEVIAGLEGISLVARLPDATCSVRWDGVPEFARMPAYDPGLIANVEAFYTFIGRRGRESGKVTLHIDPASVVSGRNATFELGATEIRHPSVTLPATGALAFEGRRTSSCGAPELRYELESAVWRTGANGAGRLIIVMHDGSPRRWLFDLDGDGRVELEAWDGDDNGAAEAKRSASYRIPSFLIPLVPARAPADTTATVAASTDSSTARGLPAVAGARDSQRLDSLRRDSVGRDSLRRGSVGQDSVRQDSVRRDSLREDSVRRDSLRRDSVRRAATRDSVRRDSVRRDSIRKDSIRRDSLRRDTVGVDTLRDRNGAVRSGDLGREVEATGTER